MGPWKSLYQLTKQRTFHTFIWFLNSTRLYFCDQNEFMQNSLPVSVLINFFVTQFGITLAIDGVSFIAASIGAVLSQIKPASPRLIQLKFDMPRVKQHSHSQNLFLKTRKYPYENWYLLQGRDAGRRKVRKFHLTWAEREDCRARK